jgi:ribosomal protein S18 acetylase RimI-like enzyme
MANTIRLVPARSAGHIQAAATLFRAYTEALGIDLTFQDFSTELNGLPGKYAPPDGELLLAYGSDLTAPLGCAAFRLLNTGGANRCCEMKRLYVSPAARGLGVGRILAARVVSEAQLQGYEEMRLDTLPSMGAARDMYRKMGFVEIDAYYATPLEGTIFLSLDLTRHGPSETPSDGAI